MKLAFRGARRVDREYFFGWRIRFFDYNTLAGLFQEIFLTAPYRVRVESPRPTIIDCGSNIGLSVLYFKRRFPTARIIAFEPDPEAFKLLRENVVRNGLSDVELHQAAVNNSDGEVDFYFDSHFRGSLHSSLIPKRSLHGHRKVRTLRLSTFIKEPVDVLKLDIQGAEAAVIDDLVSSNAFLHVRALIMEYHHHLHPGTPSLAWVLSQLERSGFGYQIATSNYHAVLPQQSFQDVMIYAYPKASV
jgi:FkbM family methyltransferase